MEVYKVIGSMGNSRSDGVLLKRSSAPMYLNLAEVLLLQCLECIVIVKRIPRVEESIEKKRKLFSDLLDEFAVQERNYKRVALANRREHVSKINPSILDEPIVDPPLVKLDIEMPVSFPLFLPALGQYMAPIPYFQSSTEYSELTFSEWFSFDGDMKELSMEVSALYEINKRGWYFSKGAKFGVDYLVYKDNPNKVHADFMLSVSPSTALSFVATGRLAVNVRKTVLFICEKPGVPKNVPNTDDTIPLITVNLLTAKWDQYLSAYQKRAK